MKTLMIGLCLAAMPVALHADQPARADREYQRDVREARRDYQRDLAEARQDHRRAVRNWQTDRRDRREFRRYDWNRPDPRYGAWYPDYYYRDGRYYRPYRLSRNDRIYRGRDGRYYCRRSDGTTGLVIGAVLGGVIGNQLDREGSSLLGTLIGGTAGGLLGREVDRGRVRCR